MTKEEIKNYFPNAKFSISITGREYASIPIQNNKIHHSKNKEDYPEIK